MRWNVCIWEWGLCENAFIAKMGVRENAFIAEMGSCRNALLLYRKSKGAFVMKRVVWIHILFCRRGVYLSPQQIEYHCSNLEGRLNTLATETSFVEERKHESTYDVIKTIDVMWGLKIRMEWNWSLFKTTSKMFCLSSKKHVHLPLAD